MIKLTHYTAFAASESLRCQNETFVAELATSPSRALAPDIIRLLELFSDECMDAYFLSPVDMIDLNPMGKKVVLGGVSAIKKTIKLALKKVLGKVPNDELIPLADYIDSMLLKPEEEGDLPTYIAVELPDELYQRITGVVQRGRDTEPHLVAKEFSIALCDLVDVAIESYFERPIEMMKLGYLSEKIARLANDTVSSGAKTVIKKVTKTMRDKELQAFFWFAESIIVDGPAKEAKTIC